jgi:hypothetical protein
MSIPAFSQFYPTEEAMTPTQRRFYADLESALRRGEYPDVEGNISYVFVFVYKLIASVKERGFESLYDYLIRLSEAYSKEPTLSNGCRCWAYDSLLGQKKYELYLEKTEPSSPLGLATHPSNLRLNVQEHCGLDANPIDILRMFESRSSKFIRENAGLYRDCVKATFERATKTAGPWFEVLIKSMQEPEKRYPHSLFQGAVIPWGLTPLAFDVRCFYASSADEAVKQLAKLAENEAREIIGVPKVGEGWISETALFRALENHFRQTTAIQHGQPAWLGRQHFDIWFPDWNIAVEFHGEQHFQAVDFFGGAEAFAKNVERDLRKAALARRHGVKLLVVTKEDDTSAVVCQIEKIIDQRAPALPPSTAP